ncbi:MAG TPA: Ig-like domain-containing protein, partial [Blastocatellia bacterium]|nr:Ig-like domain-containing protein [Blastocatellia bacterium]
MRLSDAGLSPAVAQQAANAALLDPDESSKLLARLPAAEADQSEQQEFKFSEQSPPLPRTGQQILAAFPPAGRPAAEQSPAQPASPEPAPLEVLRYAPEGEVAIAPHLSVTFSQPMVAVTSQSEAGQNVPVRLSPQPPGEWRWVGSRTLIFQPDVRFPMATRFRVEVPAGTRSAVGGTLGTARSWEFSTPAPQLETKYPDKSPTGRTPLMFVSFDQRIDLLSVIAKTRVQASGRDWKVRLASAHEIQADKSVLELSKRAQAGRWLAFTVIGEHRGQPAPPLPPGAAVDVRISSGLSSLEGRRSTEREIQFSFVTADALKIDSQDCDEHCGPGEGWTIKFNNPLDARSFRSSEIIVRPKLHDLSASVQDNHLRIDGDTLPRTAYTVTVA